MKHFSPILLIILLSSIYTQLSAQTEIQIGIYVQNMRIENTNESFYADFYWWSKIPSTVPDSLVKEYSKLEIVNGQSYEMVITERQIFDNFYYVTGRCKGRFLFNPDFKDYPFDEQYLPLLFESTNLPLDQIILIADQNSYAKDTHIGLSPDIELSNFAITSSQFDNSARLYETNFGDPDFKINSKYSRLAYRVTIKRTNLFYLLKILIPTFLILIIAYLVFFIPASVLDVAVGCTVTSLLACVALQLSFADDIPNVGYITSSDKLFYFFYAMISAALVQTVITYNMEKNGQTKSAHKLEILGRFLFPIIYIIGVIFIIG